MYKNVYEYLRPDFTRVYKLDGHRQINTYTRDIQNIVTNKTKGVIYFFHPHLGFSDYDGKSTAVERSNLRMFLKKFKKCRRIKHVSGCCGYEAIAIDITCINQEIINTLVALDDYPIINDEDHSRMENEMEEEAWESWLKRDFISAIEKKFDAYDSDPDEDELLELYYELKEKNNADAYIKPGGIFYISIHRLLEQLDEPPAFLKLEYNDAA
jgi:hypothetical protein